MAGVFFLKTHIFALVAGDFLQKIPREQPFHNHVGFIPLVESYQKTLKNGIYSFPAWRSAFMGGCGEQAGKFACCVLGQGT